MDKAEKLRNEILKIHSRFALRRMFTQRLDDDLFADLGKQTVRHARLTEENRNYLVYRGYEFLMDSPYFDDSLTKSDLDRLSEVDR
jgi:hypothetical protein